ncbi:MAG: DUF4124 domain-containing protein [Zoogloeaceae bacterium]|jgi:hypothetical protein|nr:DUF4124 domain-containing protein [Zoogloeaceae bacterium]
MNAFSFPFAPPSRRAARFWALLFLLPLAAFALSSGAAAEVYRCVINGKTVISTEPCPLGAKAETIRPDVVGEEARAAAEKEAAWLKSETERLAAAQVQRDADEAAARQAAAEEAAEAASTVIVEERQTIVEVYTGWPMLYYGPLWRHRPPPHRYRPPPARRPPPPPARIVPRGNFRPAPAPAAGRSPAIRMSPGGGGFRGAGGRGGGRWR